MMPLTGATDSLNDFPLSIFEDAQKSLQGIAIKTPLVRLNVPGRNDIFLKLENLQPVGSFKIRCAANALIARSSRIEGGVSTASAGNFAQGLAYAGARLGFDVTTYVPDFAAKSKIDALKRFGSTVHSLPFDEWWAMLSEPNDDPHFIHPVKEPEGLAGNGTIALEILDELPDVATVIAPYGGGGLSTGVAMAFAAAGTKTSVIAAETEAGAPLTASFEAGEPVKVDFDPNTFITGMGGPQILADMWPLARKYIAGTAVVTLEQTADAIRLMAKETHVIAEGAGGAPVAAALAGDFPGPVVCIISGGHLDANHLISILQGNTP